MHTAVSDARRQAHGNSEHAHEQRHHNETAAHAHISAHEAGNNANERHLRHVFGVSLIAGASRGAALRPLRHSEPPTPPQAPSPRGLPLPHRPSPPAAPTAAASLVVDFFSHALRLPFAAPPLRRQRLFQHSERRVHHDNRSCAHNRPTGRHVCGPHANGREARAHQAAHDSHPRQGRFVFSMLPHARN